MAFNLPSIPIYLQTCGSMSFYWVFGKQTVQGECLPNCSVVRAKTALENDLNKQTNKKV